MADYHILSGRPDGNQYRVVFHLPVPDTDNNVGVNYRMALVEWLGTEGLVSQVPFISAPEQTQLDNGELYEHLWDYDTHDGISLSEKQAELDARFAAFSTAVVNQLQTRLGFWGFNRDVP
jgi:hypothetical protein